MLQGDGVLGYPRTAKACDRYESRSSSNSIMRAHVNGNAHATELNKAQAPPHNITPMATTEGAAHHVPADGDGRVGRLSEIEPHQQSKETISSRSAEVQVLLTATGDESRESVVALGEPLEIERKDGDSDTGTEEASMFEFDLQDSKDLIFLTEELNNILDPKVCTVCNYTVLNTHTFTHKQHHR